MRVECFGLVVFGFQNCDAAHGRLRGGNERKVFAGNSQKNLPAPPMLAGPPPEAPVRKRTYWLQDDGKKVLEMERFGCGCVSEGSLSGAVRSSQSRAKSPIPKEGPGARGEGFKKKKKRKKKKIFPSEG